jgi:hypothetical protein
VARKIKTLDIVCNEAKKNLDQFVELGQFKDAHEMQGILETAKKDIAELKQVDSITETLLHGFAVGHGFGIQIEKNPLTEFGNYEKVSRQPQFEQDVDDFQERMAEAYPHKDFQNTYIKSNTMVKGHIKTLKERKAKAFAKLKAIRTGADGLGVTIAEEQSLYGGLNDAILALLHCLATTTNSALIDYFSDLLATSAEFINPEILRGEIKGRTLAEQKMDEEDAKKRERGEEVDGRKKRRATLNNYLLETNYARKVEQINAGRTAEFNRVKAENKAQDAREDAEARARKAKRERDLKELGKSGPKSRANKSQAKKKPAKRASPKKKKGGGDDSDSEYDEVDDEDDEDDEISVLDSTEAEEDAYSEALSKMKIKASRGDYYLSELGGFESEFDKKDDDDDLGEGDAGGSGGVASSSSNIDDTEGRYELEDGYYEAQAVFEEEARLEAQARDAARDAMIPAHARSKQAELFKNSQNKHFMADLDDDSNADVDFKHYVEDLALSDAEDLRLDFGAFEGLPDHSKLKVWNLAKRWASKNAHSAAEQEQHDLITCTVCLKEFDETDETFIGEVVFKCGHGLHETCFDNHHKHSINGDKCPTCNVTWELSDWCQASRRSREGRQEGH